MAAASFGCVSSGMPASSGHPLDGRAAPRVSVRPPGQAEVGIPSGRAETALTVVDFWASWCAPCIRAMPELERLHRQYREAGVEVIGVDVDERRSDGDAAAARAGASFTIVHDPWGRVVRAYGLRSIPMTFVLDRRGVVRWSGNDLGALRGAIDALLEEAHASAPVGRR